MNTKYIIVIWDDGTDLFYIHPNEAAYEAVNRIIAELSVSHKTKYMLDIYNDWECGGEIYTNGHVHHAFIRAISPKYSVAISPYHSPE